MIDFVHLWRVVIRAVFDVVISEVQGVQENEIPEEVIVSVCVDLVDNVVCVRDVDVVVDFR